MSANSLVPALWGFSQSAEELQSFLEQLETGKPVTYRHLTVVIAPRRKQLPLPVYCVESGRWHHVRGAFKSEKNLGTYSMHAAAQGSSGNNQMEVWNMVAESNRKMGIRSGTEAYQDVFRNEEVAKIIKACVVAMTGYQQKASFSRAEAQRFLNALQWMRYRRSPGVDLGF